MDEKDFLKASDLMKILDCSRSSAYRIMQMVREELESKGYITLHGRVPRGYTLKRLGVQ